MEETNLSTKLSIILLAFFTAVTLIFLPGCGEEKGMKSIEKHDPIFSEKDVSAGVEESIVAFGNEIFHKVYDANTNQMISPYSIASALSMVLAGAEGETKAEIMEVLNANNIAEADLHASHQALMDILRNTDPEVTLLVANSIWMNDGIDFKGEFIELLGEKYGAEAEPLTTAKEINDWVSDKTYGTIDHIVEEISPNTVMMLLNAVYFLSEWSDPFKAGLTRDRDFFRSSDDVISVPFMVKGEYFRYEDTGEYEVIRLPYGDGRFAMEVLLPEKNRSVEEILDRLNDGDFSWNSPPLEMQDGVLRFPKFSFATDLELVDVLTAMGMWRSFEGGEADFTGMTTDFPLFISQVKHKSFIDVNETGTEASAVTSVEIEATSAASDPFEMTVDRPFLFRILDETTGVILFVGHVVDPSSSE